MGWIKSYQVEDDGRHVVLTVLDKDTGQAATVLASLGELAAIVRAMQDRARAHG